MPLLNVIASELDASPTEAGLLVSSAGYGGIAATLLFVVATPRRSGLLYATAAAAASVTLAGASLPSFWLVFVAMLFSGACGGLFGAVQSALVMEMVPDELRGRALGLLTMSIGALPFGMAALGEAAERAGTAGAVRSFALAGCAAQALWVLCFPQLLRVRAGGGRD